MCLFSAMSCSAGNDVTIGNIADTQGILRFSRTSRDKHLYVCGATGTGKSKFLEHLIRQDIQSWYKSGCGMLLLDPHGSLYDSVIEWLAEIGPRKLPIIPIDLRQDDWVISYNALRRRDVANSTVVIDNFIQAMAHVWGQAGTDQTPRFARWAANIFHTLYDNDLTLLESEYLIDHLDREARRVLMEKTDDRASRRDWEFANQLKPREFEAELGSTANRLHRFLRNPKMRCMFGNPQSSIDLRRALDDGHIILVSLATAGARVSEEDADLFATLLLSDLWTAALERGKKPGIKPFYLYLDEFQRFVTPTIAQNLDEARGFGLHLTMANQFPQQLLDQGEQGTRLYHSVMENASSKVVFRLHSEENLRPLAESLFRGVMNLDEIKHTLEVTKVMGYEEVERTSRTSGFARAESFGTSSSETTASGGAVVRGRSESDGVSFQQDFEGEDLEGDRMRQTSSGVSSVESTVFSSARQVGVSHSEGATESSSETVSNVLIPIMGKEISHVQFRSLEEQLHRAMSVLFDQEQRQGVVRLAGMKAPVSFQTPMVPAKRQSPERIRRFVAQLMEKWDFALSSEEARIALCEREKGLEEELRNIRLHEEPETSRRRIDP
jgi:hypothetical protein